MTITVGRRQQPESVYIGRGSPLGNPFVMDGEGTRNDVCDKYKVWFDAKVAANDSRVMNELRRLYRLAKAGDLTLGCFCAPKRCHGDTIKGFLTQFVE